LETFTSTHQGGAARLSPSAILAALALLNFWLAAIVFAVIGLTQNAINRSVARAIGCAAVLVLVFTIVCAAGSSGIRETQVLLWGGNLVYLGTLCGWMMSDSFRR
jgi:peptidoglycan/LPS O-acetylase OafA/YrhL